MKRENHSIQTSIEYSDFIRKLLNEKGFQFVENNIGSTWWSGDSDVIQFTYVCDAFENLEIATAQINYEQNERNKQFRVTNKQQ